MRNEDTVFSKVQKMQKFTNAKIQKCKSSQIHKFKSAKMQKLKRRTISASVFDSPHH